MNNIEQLSKLFVENWTSVFNTILGKDVTVLIDGVAKINKSELEAKIGDFDSFVSMSYNEENSDKIVLLTKNKLISIISNLMIGLDTFTDEINDDDKDAFNEGINQMFASCQVPIKEILELDMKFSGMSFIEQNNVIGLFDDNEVNVWNVSVELPDISKEIFMLITPLSFGDSMVENEDSVSELKVPAKNIKENGAVGNIAGYEDSNINLILDVELPITIRIGTTEKKLVEIMRLGLGSIIELEKVVDDPVDVLVNDKLVAKGEVVVLDSNFAIRIIDVESKVKRIQSLA
jgi:flagellar motor switch protein FliN/FliY